ncbi:MAG: sensor histidine kinase [Candidatus Udaeobacter sp.]
MRETKSKRRLPFRYQPVLLCREQLRVGRNGAGIPLEMLANVFDKLATDPNTTGTDLGLAIVKQIVEAHGGSVSAESVHGSGATFRFTIPDQSASS